jgi:hypothetical protein
MPEVEDAMDVRSWVQTLAYVVGAVAALSSLVVYRANSRRERAKWLANLYEKFYEQASLKAVRNLLDEEAPDSAAVRKLVDDEDPGFTDYLNFFEFMGYLRNSGQLSRRDVTALFDYYLGCLRKHDAVRKYIADDSKGYGYLKESLLKL